MYIQHIIWRYVKNKPEQFRLLDIRYNVMKDLILGDCNHLIKFILFGDDENKDKDGRRINIPMSILWSEKKFIKDNDLDYLNSNGNKLKDEERPENNMELAIYHCKGKFQIITSSYLW